MASTASAGALKSGEWETSPPMVAWPGCVTLLAHHLLRLTAEFFSVEVPKPMDPLNVPEFHLDGFETSNFPQVSLQPHCADL